MPNKGTAKRRAPKGVLGRLIRTLFGFYPVLLPVTVACILFNAVVSSVPSIFMQNVIAAVEQSWQSGDWSAVSGRILGLVALLAVFYVLMFLYVRFSGRRSKAYYKKQQDCLGELDGYIEEMMAGQKAPSMLLPSRLARNWPVPIPLMTPPMEKDNTRRITRPIMLLTPFITLSPNSLAVMISCFVYMTHIMSSVMTTE